MHTAVPDIAESWARKIVLRCYPYTLNRGKRAEKIANALAAMPWQLMPFAAAQVSQSISRMGSAHLDDAIAAVKPHFRVHGMPVAASDGEIAKRAQDIAGRAAAEIPFLMAHVPPWGRAVVLQDWAEREKVGCYFTGKTAAWMAPRFADPAFWRRVFKRDVGRRFEALAQKANIISRKRQVFCTDHALEKRESRQKRNRQVLDMMEAVNDDGQAYTLSELAELSVSNPKLRRAELMTRCVGFERIAQVWGYVAMFFTITCPSRFHRTLKNGKPNEKWGGETVRGAVEYLRGVWSKVRAAWNRRGYSPFGFRVSEPHHDGTPHWHVLLFMPSEHVGKFDSARPWDRAANVGVSGILARYALADSPDELGAEKHRFTAKLIDPTQGSATGYIAKYIAKNVDGIKEDGEPIGFEVESRRDARDTSQRVQAWASRWGVRQFQQIGGPSVTVWRELRRERSPQMSLFEDSPFEAARLAADEGNWMAYYFEQGGPESKRSEHKLKPLYDTAEECSKYGEMRTVIRGVRGPAIEWGEEIKALFAATGEPLPQFHSLVTRRHEWRIQRRGAHAEGFGAARSASTRTRVNNCTFLPRLAEHGDRFGEVARAVRVESEVFINNETIPLRL